MAVHATVAGAAIVSFPVRALGPQVARPFSLSAVSETDLGYQLLAAAGSGRLKVPGATPGGR